MNNSLIIGETEIETVVHEGRLGIRNVVEFGEYLRINSRAKEAHVAEKALKQEDGLESVAIELGAESARWTLGDEDRIRGPVDCY